MNKKYLWLLLPLALVLVAATVVTPGKRITEYPRVTTLSDSDVLVAGRTNVATPTNVGITALNLLVQATNGLASTSYVTTVVTGALTSIPAELWTNSGGIVRLNTNGPVSIASTGLLGGLVVTQDMRILGHNVASNYIWVATNATTGEGEWRDISALLSPVGINPRTNLFNVQYEPVRGSTWYSGTNGIPTTNEARAGLEFSPFWRSLRMGQVAGGADVHGVVGNGSNYWNNTNIGPLTVGFGTNPYVKAAYSSVLGGSGNAITTNCNNSVIGGGQNNLIDIFAPNATIGGGGKNVIRPVGAAAAESDNATIGGGSNNVITGSAILNATIGGGGDNNIDSAKEGTISGGFANQIEKDARYSYVGGGINNTAGNFAASADESTACVMVGGEQNQSQGDHSFVGGGFQNGVVARGGNNCVVVGGQGNTIGTAPASPALFATIVGGFDNDIAAQADYAFIGGGHDNDIDGGGTNNVIAGGAFNTSVGASKFVSIVGGERHAVSGNYSFSLGGASNSVTAARAGAIGMNVTNSTAGSVTVGELISYNTPAVIAGAGTGSTNYLLAVTSPKMLLGSSNVHIYGVSGTIAGKTHKWSANITNLSGDTWGIGFSSGTNRWKFQSYMYGTSAPVVLTNNTLLRLNGESEGTNTLVTYEYFAPAL